jgi:hypothetical protein
VAVGGSGSKYLRCPFLTWVHGQSNCSVFLGLRLPLHLAMLINVLSNPKRLTVLQWIVTWARKSLQYRRGEGRKRGRALSKIPFDSLPQAAAMAAILRINCL